LKPAESCMHEGGGHGHRTCNPNCNANRTQKNSALDLLLDMICWINESVWSGLKGCPPTGADDDATIWGRMTSLLVAELMIGSSSRERRSSDSGSKLGDSGGREVINRTPACAVRSRTPPVEP